MDFRQRTRTIVNSVKFVCPVWLFIQSTDVIWIMRFLLGENYHWKNLKNQLRSYIPFPSSDPYKAALVLITAALPVTSLFIRKDHQSCFDLMILQVSGSHLQHGCLIPSMPVCSDLFVFLQYPQSQAVAYTAILSGP